MQNSLSSRESAAPDTLTKQPDADSGNLSRRSMLQASLAAIGVGALSGIPASAAERQQEGRELRVEGNHFPMRIGYCSRTEWEKNFLEIRKNPNAIFSIMKFIGQPDGRIPAGEWVVWLAPSSSWGYDVKGEISRDGGKSYGQGKFSLTRMTIGAQDDLRVRQTEILPPDNAAVAPYKGGQILVSTMFPVAIENPQDFKGKEEFRSTAMFLAKYGDNAVARTLAQHALANMGKPNDWNARSSQQISVTFQTDAQGKVLPAQASGSLEELTQAIEAGIRACRAKPLRCGTTFDEQVKKAEQLLKK